jgi:hypothetical protein
MTIGRALRSIGGAIVIVTTIGAGTTYAKPHRRVYVRVGPPAAIVEVRPVAPRGNFIWVPGYHRWNSGAYVWVPGAWQRPPRARAAWIPGHWAHDRRGWFFVEGRWK